MTDTILVSDMAIPPGDYLEEALEDAGMSQAELAKRMGQTPQAINEIIKGKKVITPETALQLEQVLGVSARFWSNLERLSQIQLQTYPIITIGSLMLLTNSY